MLLASYFVTTLHSLCDVSRPKIVLKKKIKSINDDFFINDVFCIKISTDCTETSKFVREERLSQQFRQLSPKLLLVPHSLIKYGNTKSPVKTGTILSLIKNYLLFHFQRCTLSTLVNWCARRIQSEGTLGSKLKRRCTLTAESKFGRSGWCKIFRIASGEIPLRLKYL